jgi:uncharacterized repeat protein (TIGR01451 family)
MIEGIRKYIGVAAILACSFGSQAFAQSPAKDCTVTLKTTAEVEQDVVGANGEKTKQLVPVQKVVPGKEVVWTITASNPCKKASDNVTINNPVPEHMTYVAGSAFGAGSVISYSVDGATFGSPEELTVTDNGAKRKARADEYRHIRWVFKSPLQPGATAVARFRAVLN